MFKKKGIVGSIGEKAIVTVDPYSLKTYMYKKANFENSSAKELAKNNFIISYVQTKDIISSTVDISRSIAGEDLRDAIEIKAYDELGLDSGAEYSIFYFESQKQDGDERVFNVIAVDKASLYDIFSDVKDVKYVDYITTAPFLFKSLYTKNIIEPTQTDCFIYLHKDDAHVTIYQDGEYIFSKSIKYSLKVISDTFSKELGKHVDENEFFDMLSKTGLQNKNSTYQQQLMKLFGEVFVYINDVILYAKRAYNLDKIDQIHMGTEIGYIAGLEEFCHNYVNIPTKNLEIKIAKNAAEFEVDAVHGLLALTAQDFMDGKIDEEMNISIFKKPPPFKNRPSGKLVQIAAATFLLSMAYPTYQFVYENMFLKQNLETLNSEYQQKSKESSDRKAAFASTQASHKKIEEKLLAKNKELDFRTKLLHEIYAKKVSYPMKAEVLTDLFSKITKHQSKVTNVDNNASDMVITIRSKKDKHITELLTELAEFKKYDVSTQMIKKDDNSSYYESAIKVGLHVN
jgi:hypothetical protein